MTTLSVLPVPDIASDSPVAVIPTASVAPLDGRPDGERINIYTIRPTGTREAVLGLQHDLRRRVVERPLCSTVIAFTLGYLAARVLR